MISEKERTMEWNTQFVSLQVRAELQHKATKRSDDPHTPTSSESACSIKVDFRVKFERDRRKLFAQKDF